ncbi:MAG: YsnF/AvaK domain-containing protein [Chloroflexota bacterium]|nr:YsnF/AvaK domain-containing protein [Chloroflexota bacterium]
MVTQQYQVGMIVDCLGTRLGTLTNVQGSGDNAVLVVRPDAPAAGAQLLHIPARLVTQVQGNTILLNVACEEATRLGQSAGQATTQLETVATTATTAGPTAGITELAAGQSLTVPVIEETLTATKQWQQAGILEIRKTVRTVNQDLDVPVQYEEATVERVPVNRVLADGETLAPRQDGNTLIVPVIHEELVVMKRRVLVEEVRITKRLQTTTQHFSEPVQREEVEITQQGLEAHGAPGAPGATDR